MRAVSENAAVLRYDNFTACCGLVSCGALSVEKAILQGSFLVFDQCFAQERTAGVCVRGAKAFGLNYVMFVMMTTAGHDLASGAALTAVNCSWGSRVDHVSFMETKRLTGFTLFVLAEANDSVVVEITACCFSGPAREEIGGNGNVVAWDNSSLFECTECDELLAFMLPRAIGYVREVHETPVPIADLVFSQIASEFIGRAGKSALWAGGAFGAVLWGIVKIFGGRRGRKRERRVEPPGCEL
jgi:hypothetical protein